MNIKNAMQYWIMSTAFQANEEKVAAWGTFLAQRSLNYHEVTKIKEREIKEYLQRKKRKTHSKRLPCTT